MRLPVPGSMYKMIADENANNRYANNRQIIFTSLKKFSMKEVLDLGVINLTPLSKFIINKIIKTYEFCLKIRKIL